MNCAQLAQSTRSFPELFCKKLRSNNFAKLAGKKPSMDTLHRTYGLHRKYFPVNFETFFRAFILRNTYEVLFLANIELCPKFLQYALVSIGNPLSASLYNGQTNSNFILTQTYFQKRTEDFVEHLYWNALRK